MDKNDFWDYSQPGTGPLLTPQLLSYAEELMNFKLPPLLIDLLRIKNGGKTNDLAFPVSRKTSLGDKYLPIDGFYGIIDQSLSVKPNILHSAYLSQEWNLPEKQILLTGDANNRVVENTIIWENFIAEEKLIELDDKFLAEVNKRRKQKGLREIVKP